MRTRRCFPAIRAQLHQPVKYLMSLMSLLNLADVANSGRVVVEGVDASVELWLPVVLE